MEAGLQLYLESDSDTSVFLVIFVKVLRIPFFIEHVPETASVNWYLLFFFFFWEPYKSKRINVASFEKIFHPSVFTWLQMNCFFIVTSYCTSKVKIKLNRITQFSWRGAIFIHTKKCQIAKYNIKMKHKSVFGTMPKIYLGGFFAENSGL